MRDLIIHAGPAKTGSSTIQRFLFANAQVLAEAGCYIPKPSTGALKGNHAQLLWRPGSDAAADPAAAAALTRELSEQDFPRIVILSHEGYGRVLGKPAFRQMLAAYAASIGYRVTVVSFVRPQLALLNSHYNELSKKLQPMPSLGEMLQRWTSARPNNYERWRTAFSAGNLLAVKFLPFTASATRAGLGQTLLRGIGLPGAAIARCQPVERLNPSLGPKALAAMHAIAAEVEDAVKDASPERVSGLATLLRDMLTAKGWNEGRFDGLDAAAKQALRDAYAQSNEAFARAAWNTSWQDVFGDDEAELLAQPKRVYEPAAAGPAERAEFEEFCREGAALVREMLGRR